MINHSFARKLTGAAFVAAILASGAATAAPFSSQQADPFMGQTVDLQATGHQLMALPGTGPLGSTLYATDFLIRLFQAPTTISDGHGGIITTYDASFIAKFLNADGTAALIPGTSTQGVANLRHGIFQVDFLNRPNATATGTFEMQLLQATFSGTTNIGTNLYVNLANPSNANVTIADPVDVDSDYTITYNKDFVIQGQYRNNLDGSGPAISVPALGDAGHGPAAVPLPAAIWLFAPVSAFLFRLSRRRTA